MLIRIGGVPVYMDERNLLYIVYSVVAMTCLLSMFMGIILDVVFTTDDFKHSMESVRAICMYVAILWMHTYLRFRRGTINRLLRLTEQFTWEELPTIDRDSGNSTMTAWIPRVQNVLTYSCLFVAVYHLIIHSILRMRSHALVFNAWYPLNLSLSPQYELVFVSQLVASIVLFGNLFGFMSIYAVLVCVGCSQLEKFTYNMLHMKQNCDIMGSKPHSNKETGEINLLHHSQEIFGHMYKELTAYIRHHQTTLEYLQYLEGGLSFGLCGLFLILLLAICVIAFSAITSWGDHMDQLQALFAYLMLMGNLLVVCWFGTKLTEKAEILRDAVFGCDWIGTPTSFQRCLIFIIRMANKKFEITAGGFAPISNITLMHMANQTMSFFMFLLHMMDRKEHVNNVTK